MSIETIDVLFVGGPADGKIAKIPKSAKVWYESVRQIDMFEVKNAESHEEVNFQYVRFEMIIERGEIHYFRPADWSERDTVMHFVNTYRRGASKEQKAEETTR